MHNFIQIKFVAGAHDHKISYFFKMLLNSQPFCKMLPIGKTVCSLYVLSQKIILCVVVNSVILGHS